LRIVEAERAAQQPAGTDQQVKRIAEEGGLVPLDHVAEKLKCPADNEQCKRPAPVEEKQRQRNDDQWNANAVREFVQRMAVLGFVIVYERFRHKTYLNERGEARGAGPQPERFSNELSVFCSATFQTEIRNQFRLAHGQERGLPSLLSNASGFQTSRKMSIVPPQTMPSSLASSAVKEK
jgi:hypothetical protein